MSQMKKKKFEGESDFTKMTEAQERRQVLTLKKRKEIDFKSVTDKLAKNGTDLDQLTELDEFKLKNGSEAQIKAYLRYGLGMGQTNQTSYRSPRAHNVRDIDVQDMLQGSEEERDFNDDYIVSLHGSIERDFRDAHLLSSDEKLREDAGSKVSNIGLDRDGLINIQT